MRPTALSPAGCCIASTQKWKSGALLSCISQTTLQMSAPRPLLSRSSALSASGNNILDG